MQSLSIVYTILWSYNRRRELLWLCRWARAKHLSKPLSLYRFRLQDEEVRLNHHSLKHPHLTGLAYAIHLVNALCFRLPRYPRRGAAWGYTRQAMLQSRRDGDDYL